MVCLSTRPSVVLLVALSIGQVDCLYYLNLMLVVSLRVCPSVRRVRLSVNPSICLSVSRSLFWPLSLSVGRFVCLSLCHLSVLRPVCLSACPPARLPVCPSACLPACLPVCLSACLPVCMSVHQSGPSLCGRSARRLRHTADHCSTLP